MVSSFYLLTELGEVGGQDGGRHNDGVKVAGVHTGVAGRPVGNRLHLEGRALGHGGRAGGPQGLALHSGAGRQEGSGRKSSGHCD
eukprot:1190037-Prorocentrum_minimum.AAC.1